MTTLTGSLGLSPAGSITQNGTLTYPELHNGDDAAKQAYTDMEAAYLDAEGRASTGSFPADGEPGTYVAGVYNQSAGSAPTGILTLDGQNDPNSVFIFQIGGAFAPTTTTRMLLVNNAQAGNVFWQIAGAFTPAADTVTVGTIMAKGAFSMGAGAKLNGRVLVTAAGTFSTNTITTPAAPTPITTPGPPTAVSATASDGQATITFTPPTNTGGSAIIDYTVTTNGGTPTITASSSPITISGLTNATTYTFTVTARNSTGSSDPSSTSNSVTPTAAPTPITTPGPPTAVSATASDGQATITFTPPTNTGGSAIIDYTVTTNGGTPTITASSSPITISGLTNATTYTFTVTARNSTGSSDPSSTSNSVTPTAVSTTSPTIPPIVAVPPAPAPAPAPGPAGAAVARPEVFTPVASTVAPVAAPVATVPTPCQPDVRNPRVVYRVSKTGAWEIVPRFREAARNIPLGALFTIVQSPVPPLAKNIRSATIQAQSLVDINDSVFGGVVSELRWSGQVRIIANWENLAVPAKIECTPLVAKVNTPNIGIARVIYKMTKAGNWLVVPMFKRAAKAIPTGALFTPVRSPIRGQSKNIHAASEQVEFLAKKHDGQSSKVISGKLWRGRARIIVNW